jgi:hypothetical protein
LEKYKLLKRERSGETQNDGSVIFYVITTAWVDQWKAFIKQGLPKPGIIDNSNLQKYIQQRRAEMARYANLDDEVNLQQGVDYYEFTKPLWKFFYENYGVKCII